MLGDILAAQDDSVKVITICIQEYEGGRRAKDCGGTRTHLYKSLGRLD
jgi:hypothetical protein